MRDFETKKRLALKSLGSKILFEVFVVKIIEKFRSLRFIQWINFDSNKLLNLNKSRIFCANHAVLWIFV